MKEGYKKTEIGVIPEDWEVRELNEISSITRLAGAEYSDLWQAEEDGEIIALRGFNIGENKLILNDVERISKSLSERLNRSKLYKNDIVFPCVGTIGKATVINENDKYHINQNIAKITPDNNMNSLYLSYFLIGDMVKKEILKYNTSSSQPNVLVGNLRKFKIIKPPLKEQEKIAEILSSVDCQIDDTEMLIEKYRVLKKGLMQRLLSKGIGHSEFKMSEVGEIPVGWELYKIGEICSLINGRAFKPQEWKEDGIPIIRIQNLNGSNEFNYYQGEIDEKHLIRNGNLLFSWSGSRGTSFGPHIWKGVDGVLNQHIFKVKLNESKSINKMFIYYNLKYITEKIEQEAHGSAGLVHITKGALEKIKIVIPNIDEQIKISELLISMDNEIEEYENKKQNLEELKKGLMQQLLTGKIRTIF